MPVITIRGQEASGAPEIGTMVAKELQIDYVDSRIIADVAARLNRHEMEVLKKETPPLAPFWTCCQSFVYERGSTFRETMDLAMERRFTCQWTCIRGKYRLTTNFICKL